MINLDLLRALTLYHPDGRAKDPHAHHRDELLAAHHEARKQAWLAVFRSLRHALRLHAQLSDIVAPCGPAGPRNTR